MEDNSLARAFVELIPLLLINKFIPVKIRIVGINKFINSSRLISSWQANNKKIPTTIVIIAPILSSLFSKLISPGMIINKVHQPAKRISTFTMLKAFNA